MIRLARLSAALMLIQGLASAQEWENTVSRLESSVARAYVASVPSGFGANLNTGWFHSAPPATKMGFNVKGGIISMATLVGGGAKTLNVAGALVFDSAGARNLANRLDTTGMGPSANAIKDSAYAILRRDTTLVNFRGPTILGSDEDTIRAHVSNRVLIVSTGPGTLDTVTIVSDSVTVRGATGLLGDLHSVLGSLQALPLFIPQLTLGTIMGTNVTLRWLPETQTLEELGTVKLFGVGVQHNPAVWMQKPLPVDFCMGYFNQTLEVGDLMVAKSWALALNVSKTYGKRFVSATPYGGLQYESSQMDFSYTYTDGAGQSRPVRFSVEGENKVRATVGVSVRVLAVNFNLDYGLSKYSTGSFGFMVGL